MEIAEYIEDLLVSIGPWAPIGACFLILIESILPILPLFVFITINFLAFGNIIGFIISWLFTCLGCFLSYFLVRKGLVKWTRKKFKKLEVFDKSMLYVKKLPLSVLSCVLACPFTPAFAINIAAGLAEMNFKKFALAIFIGKIFMVYFWGYIGTGLIESLKSPTILIKVLIMVLIAYLLSIIVNKIAKDKTK